MSTARIPLLLCTNGSDTTLPALEQGGWLAGLLKAPVLLLGVVETPAQQKPVEALVQSTSKQLRTAGVEVESRIEAGRGSLVIANRTRQGQYLAVVGPLGRPVLRRVLQGRSFRRIMERVETPILYVRTARLPLKRLLICLGGLEYAAGVERLGLHLARAAGAAVTLLHVVEPITLDYPTARQVHDHWQTILETPTPQGQNLRRALDEVLATGLPAEFKVRHGSVVHEILEEARTGGYDLVGMGSAYSAHSLRHLYMPNVTAEVAEVLEIPVLAVRQGHDLLSE
jgi:nucleotide-binding universal stress UspA family protein